MFRKILVPMDGSPAAEAILPNLRELAGAFGAKVVLMRVAFTFVFPGVDPTDAQVRTTGEAKAYLDKIREELEADGFGVEPVVRYGFPAEEILAHEAREDIDLTAMSTHSRRGPARWVLGSVAEEVLRHAAKPVFLFRAPKEAEPQPAAEEALSGAAKEDCPMDKYDPKKILVPVDFSEHSEKALLAAKDVAEHRGATLTLLHVMAEPQTAVPYEVYVDWENLKKDIHKDAER